ncbi:MAG: hypothetical protein QE269_03870 [Fimbriimonas sp.]|nr:hypothetical protein [Fimbriimonas sp.]
MIRRLLTLTLIVFVASLTTAMPPANRASGNWEPVHQYIVDHAIHVDPGAEESLFVEASLGIETWETFGTASRIASKQGFGTGWPSGNTAVHFPTVEEAESLAALVRQATNLR